MKLKKNIKKILIISGIIVFLGIIATIILINLPEKNLDNETIKVINEVEKYDYKLKETKTKRYKKMFEELKEILKAETVDEESYVSKITEMFIYDFYSLEDKTAKTDVGGVEFVYQPVLENFLINAQDTYYKYVESNIYNNRNQQLPEVDAITINSITKELFAYGDKNDENAYIVNVSWTYTDNQFSTYQKNATLVFIHDGNKLFLVELK